jgi:chromosome segregation ATPase
MSQELTSEQRLTQIEKILESAIKLSHINTAKIDANSDAIKTNTEAIAALTNRVDRLTEKTENNTEAIDALTNRVDRLTEQMGRATEMFIDSMGVIRTMQTNIETMQTNIETMQSEIRGLQVENRRIIDRVFGEDNRE